MRVGYARVSDKDQSMEAQLGRLADCERIFGEKSTGRKIERPEWDRCLEFCREGDTLVVTRLDRIARSVSGLCSTVAELERKAVNLVVLDQAIDTSTPVGRLMFHVIAAIGEFELDIRRDAVRAGIELARAKGLYRGRSYTLAPDDVERLYAEYESGVRVAALARRYRLHRSTVYRYIRHRQPAPRATSA